MSGKDLKTTLETSGKDQIKEGEFPVSNLLSKLQNGEIDSLPGWEYLENDEMCEVKITLETSVFFNLPHSFRV